MRSRKVVIGQCRTGGKGLFAAAPCVRGEILIDFRGSPVVSRPTRISLQVDVDRHIEGSADTNAYLNHSCEPTAYYDYAGVYLRARRDLGPGDEITVNYNAGDYDLHEKFVCRCGSPDCVGVVRGYRYLSPAQRAALEPLLAPYLRRGGEGMAAATPP